MARLSLLAAERNNAIVSTVNLLTSLLYLLVFMNNDE